MALSAGTRLGPYDITAEIGAGGMGVVYRARDTRLDRDVAITILSPEIAAAPDLRERFEREARTVASLNHPHICTLHDYQVYVKRFSASEERWQISTGYGEEPLWSAAGDEISFRQGREWFSVSVRTRPEFEQRSPRFLFRGPYLNIPGLSYDVTPDGRRFFLLKQREQPPATEIHVVANWFEELRRIAPAQ